MFCSKVDSLLHGVPPNCGNDLNMGFSFQFSSGPMLPLCFFLCYLTCEVQFVGDWNTDSAKKKHHESDSTPCLMEWKAKKMWTAIKKGEKTLEALTLFSRVMKNISPDQRIHGGGGTARPPSAPLSLACVRRGIENAKHGGWRR